MHLLFLSLNILSSLSIGCYRLLPRFSTELGILPMHQRSEGFKETTHLIRQVSLMPSGLHGLKLDLQVPIAYEHDFTALAWPSSVNSLLPPSQLFYCLLHWHSLVRDSDLVLATFYFYNYKHDRFTFRCIASCIP